MNISPPQRAASQAQDRLAALLRAVAAGPPASRADELLAEAVTGGQLVAPDVVGCSITEVGDQYQTLASSSAAMLELDLVQYRAGRGPCVYAAQDGRQYLASESSELIVSLPGWENTAGRHGVGAVLSVPLPGPGRAGANFYAAASGGLRSAVVSARAGLLARVIASLLASGPPDGERVAGQLSGAAGERELLSRALAAVARQDELSEAEAFARLARQSAREGRSILLIARDIAGEPGQHREASR